MTLQEPDAILAKLQGQTIVLPDLEPIFDGWPRGVNQNLEQLRRDVDGWLGSAMKHSTRLGSLKAADIGYWGATWWPQAKYERLRIGTFLVAWLFVWDDELDMKDGSLWHSFELSNSYRNETREYVQYCLGLTDENHHFIAGAINATVRAFETIGEAICKAYDHDQRKRLMVDMEQFIEMTRTEQMLRLRGTLPSLEEFWSYRLGSSAVPVIIAMNEFAWGTNGLPAILLKDGDVKLLCDYTNIIISTLNDILSLKKEIACGSIGSMIPLLYAQSSDAQMAVDQTAQYLFANVKAFRDTVQRLLGSDRKDGLEGPPELYNLIEGCQIYCTGNLTWRNVPVQYEPFVTLLTLGIQSCYPTIWNVRPGHDWWSACYTLSVGQGLVGLCPI